MVLIGLLLLAIRPIKAANIEWDGGSLGDYSDLNSWDPMQVPVVADNVTFPLSIGTTNQVDFHADQSANDVQLTLASGFGGDVLLHSDAGLFTWSINSLTTSTFSGLTLDELNLTVANTIDLGGDLTIRGSSVLAADINMKTATANILEFDNNLDIVFGHIISGSGGSLSKSGSNQMTLTASNP